LQPNARGEWRISHPISARGDESLINGFLWRIIPGWRVESFVSDDPAADLSAYGLQPPEQELVFGRGTNDLLVIQFGGSPSNRADLVYARLLRHSNVVLTARTNLDWLRIPYSVWRDHLLTDIDPRQVDEIIGHNGLTNGTYHVRRTTNDHWRITSPEALLVDTNLVTEFFNHMNSIEVVSEKDVVTDLAPYGLTEPARQFEFLSLTNGVATNVFPTLSFGVSSTTNTFARRSDETAVYSIAPAAFDALPIAHWQWRDRSVWTFQTNEVRRVHIAHNHRTREVLRSPEGKWLLAPGSTGVMEPDLAFDEAIFQLGQLRADRWVARGRSESIRTFYGFASNNVHRVSIETLQRGLLRTNTIEFGGVNAEGRPFAVVQLEDDQPWFFEFPMPLYYTLVKRSLTLPESR
jgi:hypothetical protein